MFVETSAGPRKEQKARTRAALKEAGRRCFCARGFGGTTVADISREAGVALGTFYVHFQSKEALLDEILSAWNEGLVARLLPAAGSSAAPLARRVEGVAGAFLDHFRAERPFVACYAERAAHGLTMESLRDGINPQAAGLIAALLAQTMPLGAPPGVSLELAAQGLLALWLRVGLQHVFGGVSRADAVATLTRLTAGAIAGLMPPPARPRRRKP